MTFLERVISRQLSIIFNTLRPRQNGRHFADDPFKRIFLNATLRISIKISLNFVPKRPINNIPALVQIMAWRRPGDKPLSESTMVSLLTRPQCVNQSLCTGIFPDKLKRAKVIPWYKKEDNTSFGNYRPKSLLSSMSKSFERVSFNQLYDYFTSNGLLYESQCGFR